MKLTKKFKSPNYNLRKKNHQIKYIIIHYTSLKDIDSAISYLCTKKNKVSCHYLISQIGNIYNLVDDEYRAWHAGVSSWHEDTDINSYSIGIELDFSYKYFNNKQYLEATDEWSLSRNIPGHSTRSPNW